MIIGINSNQNEDEKLNSERKDAKSSETIIQTIWFSDFGSYTYTYRYVIIMQIRPICWRCDVSIASTVRPEKGWWLQNTVSICSSCAIFMMFVYEASNKSTFCGDSPLVMVHLFRIHSNIHLKSWDKFLTKNSSVARIFTKITNEMS